MFIVFFLQYINKLLFTQDSFPKKIEKREEHIDEKEWVGLTKSSNT